MTAAETDEAAAEAATFSISMNGGTLPEAKLE
jgi:hypothetical protein